MAFCTGCGKEVPAGAGACPGCGQAAAGAAPAGTAAPASGLTDNVAAALAYIPIVGLIFLLIEPYNRNRFVKFHCVQSLLFAVAYFVLVFIVGLIPLVNLIAVPLVILGMFVLWIVLALKAYQGQKFKLPAIGDIAEQQANA